jgi:hypothetical protein
MQRRRTIEDFKAEIRAAQARRLDGFALNSGGWEKTEGGRYKKRTAMMYEAARQLGTNFQLFISADYCCGNGTEETRDMIESFARTRTSLRYDGRPPVFLRWRRSRQQRRVHSPKRAHDAARSSCRTSNPRPAITEHRKKSTPSEVARDFPDWTASSTSARRATASIWRSRIQFWRRVAWAGQDFHGQHHAVLPRTTAATSASSRRAASRRRPQWEGRHKGQRDLVEIVTWNDWAESSYVAPFGTPGETKLCGRHTSAPRCSTTARIWRPAATTSTGFKAGPAADCAGQAVLLLPAASQSPAVAV